jgi:hypothetical protein
VSLAPIVDTFEAVEHAERVEQERRYPDRLYRLLSRQIDQACDQVERVNLAGGGSCPDDVRAFVGYLQLQAGEAANRPRTSAHAHDELFRLSSVLLGRPADLGVGRPAAELEAER